MTDRIIKAYMVLRGISQKELAKEVGVTATTLNHKINGKYPFYKDEMDIISKILDVPIEELFFTNTISRLKTKETETA